MNPTEDEAFERKHLIDYLLALHTSHEELVKALEGLAGPDEPQRFPDYELWSAWRLRVEKWKIAKAALDNAAKLAPTRTGGSGLCQGKKGVL